MFLGIIASPLGVGAGWGGSRLRSHDALVPCPARSCGGRFRMPSHAIALNLRAAMRAERESHDVGLGLEVVRRPTKGRTRVQRNRLDTIFGTAPWKSPFDGGRHAVGYPSAVQRAARDVLPLGGWAEKVVDDASRRGGSHRISAPPDHRRTCRGARACWSRRLCALRCKFRLVLPGRNVVSV